MTVDAVLFDLDDTLCRYRRGGARLLAEGFERVGVEPLFTLEAYHARYREHLGEIDDIDAFREYCFAELAEERGADPELGREVARIYADERDQTAVDPLDGVPDVVEELADDHAVGLITNGPTEMQRTKLSAVDLDGIFEVEVFAGYDAPAKPDPEPFVLALDELRVDPQQAVHVGNSLTTDVAGANAAGVGAVWLREDGATAPAAIEDEPGPEPDYVIEELEALTEPPW